MLIFFTVVHVILCIFMIFVILLQPGKDAGMGAALGGGAATTAFGGRGAATFLTKLTAFCAIAFFLTSLGLSFVGLRSAVSDDLAAETATTPAPAPTNTAPTTPIANPPAPEAAPANPADVAPKPTAADPAPSVNDAVPAQKLPSN